MEFKEFQERLLRKMEIDLDPQDEEGREDIEDFRKCTSIREMFNLARGLCWDLESACLSFAKILFPEDEWEINDFFSWST